MKCNNCPAAWETGGMTECGYEFDAWGCLIRGIYYGGEGESCYLSKDQVEKRLDELKRYNRGEIKRPQWILNKFVRELVSQMGTVQCGLPGFPPLWQKGYKNGDDEYCMTVQPLYGETDRHYQSRADYRLGYEDAKAGREFDARYT